MSGSAAAATGSKEEGSAEQFFIDVILTRHARKLLASYRLHDLASFAANLEDYELVQGLRKERSVTGLSRIHLLSKLTL